MAKVLRFNEYKDWDSIAFEFVQQIQNPIISESDEQSNNNDINSLIKDILDRFGFEMSLALTFGSGVKLMYPIVAKLIDNMNLEIVPSKEDIILLCITSISIMYLHNKKNPLISADDIKNKLNPEIQMKFGNPRSLVNKIIKCFHYIHLFIKRFPKLFGVTLNNLTDMFGYTAILQPTMNAISLFAGTYNLTPDNLIGNLISLAAGVSTISVRKLYSYIKDKVNKSTEVEDVLSDVTDLQEIDMGKNKLIKEQ
jgi:hypothetical protein